MTCMGCARGGVPMDARDPSLCVACAIRRRLQRLGPFPSELPEFEHPVSRIQVNEDPGRHVRLTCATCKALFWWERKGKRPPERCVTCAKARRLAQNRESKRRRVAA